MLDKVLFIKRVIKNARKYRNSEIKVFKQFISIPLNFVPDGIRGDEQFRAANGSLVSIINNHILVEVIK